MLKIINTYFFEVFIKHSVGFIVCYKPHGKQMGKQWKQFQTLFFWAPKSLRTVAAAMKLKDVFSLEEKL